MDIIGIRREGGAGSAMSSGWNHPDSTWEKSKRKTERNLATDCRKGDAGVGNQLGRAEEESKRQATVARLWSWPYVPKGTKRIE